MEFTVYVTGELCCLAVVVEGRVCVVQHVSCSGDGCVAYARVPPCWVFGSMPGCLVLGCLLCIRWFPVPRQLDVGLVVVGCLVHVVGAHTNLVPGAHMYTPEGTGAWQVARYQHVIHH